MRADLTRIFGLMVFAIHATIVFSAYFDVYEAPRAVLEVITSMSSVIGGVILAICIPRGIWSVSFIFYAVFALFHVGLVVASSLNGITDEDILYQISWWFYNKQTENAIHLVNIALVSFCAGVLLLMRTSNRTLKPTKVENGSYQLRLFHIGGAVLSLFVLIFFALTISTGAISSYGAYLQLTSSIPLLSFAFSYTYVFIGLGIVMVCVCYRSGFSSLYFILFAIWALFAFRMGLRGEVMFPGSAAAAMLGRRFVPIKAPMLMVLIVLFLIITGVVKNARISGDYSGDVSINPLNAVAEMGSSLRAVQEVILWREGGDQLMLGASYWAPIERQLALVLPGLKRPDALEDPRLLNVVVQERAGPIGFSPVAEAYINFGEKGVAFIFLLFGMVMALLDNLRSSTKIDIMIGVCLVPVFIMVRNAFTHVPVQIVIGLAIAGMLMYLAYQDGLSKEKSGADHAS